MLLFAQPVATTIASNKVSVVIAQLAEVFFSRKVTAQMTYPEEKATYWLVRLARTKEVFLTFRILRI